MQREMQQAKDLNEVESDMERTRVKIASLKASLGEIESDLRQQPNANTVSTSVDLNSIREAARLKRLELESALIAARDHYREDSPEVQEIRSDIAKYDEMIAREPERVERTSTQGLNNIRQQLILNRNASEIELQAQLATLAAMDSTRATLEARLVNVPAMQQEMRDMDREVSLAQEKFQALKLKRAEAVVSLSTVKSAMPSLRVIDYALPPAGKSWPRLKYLYPGGLAAGLLLGLLAALVQSHMSGRIFAEDLRLTAASMPVYGILTSGAPPLLLAVELESSARDTAGAHPEGPR
jgi:uncharacterized protein involved in exopolysaccharide biosynthesis